LLALEGGCIVKIGGKEEAAGIGLKRTKIHGRGEGILREYGSVLRLESMERAV